MGGPNYLEIVGRFIFITYNVRFSFSWQFLSSSCFNGYPVRWCLNSFWWLSIWISPIRRKNISRCIHTTRKKLQNLPILWINLALVWFDLIALWDRFKKFGNCVNCLFVCKSWEDSVMRVVSAVWINSFDATWRCSCDSGESIRIVKPDL